MGAQSLLLGYGGGGGGGASVTFVDSSATTFSTTTSQNYTIPATVLAGDLLLAFVMHRDTLTTPTGWTVVDTSGAFTTSNQYTTCLKRIAQAGDAGATVTFTQASSQRMGAEIQVFRKTGGCDVVASANSKISDTGTNAYECPAMQGTASGQMLAQAASSLLAATTIPNTMSVSSGWTITTPTSSDDTSNQIRLGAAYRDADTASALAATFTKNFSGTNNGWGAVSVLVG